MRKAENDSWNTMWHCHWEYKVKGQSDLLQQFASKHKPQTFSRVCLRLKRGVYRWKPKCFTAHVTCYNAKPNLVPRACDPWEGNAGSGIIRFREESDWPLKWMRSSILARIPGFRQRIIPEPSFPSRGSQARGTRLQTTVHKLQPVDYSYAKYLIRKI
jgi:hypothetical protein